MRMLETHPDVPLDVWMKVQGYLWKEMVEEGVVETNDYTLFFKFGDWFNKYYHSTLEFPQYEEVVAYVTSLK